jgi:hypothetical protein
MKANQIQRRPPRNARAKSACVRIAPPASIRGWRFHVVDDDDVDHVFFGLQLQAGLLGEGSEYADVVKIGIGTEPEIGCGFEFYVVSAGEAGLIHHGAIRKDVNVFHYFVHRSVRQGHGLIAPVHADMT